MSGADIAITVGTTVIGVLTGFVISYYFYRRGGAARPRVVIGLEEVAQIDPATVGVQVKMKIGTIEVSNLLVLEVIIRNRGPHDLVVADADDPTKHDLRPRIELPAGVRTLADPWSPEGLSPAADVRLARLFMDGKQVIFVHIHRLARGASSSARIVCTYRESTNAQPLSKDAVQFFPGFLPDVDIRAAGLLEEPPALLNR